MPSGTRVKVLCVDDEPNVVESLSLLLRRWYDVVSAKSGEEGLASLRDQGPFAVVLSDMRMPGMDGAAFLSQAKALAPDTTRMLLTGHADLQAAVAAVNEGQIFRFLTKPCPPEHLRLAFDAATHQYRLVTAERVLLEQTLRGSIKTLTDILSMVSPVVFGRASRIRQHAQELVEHLELKDTWALDVAAMLSQLGAIAVPEEVVNKLYRGHRLSGEEQAMVNRMPVLTDGFLANIPRMEIVREILAQLSEVPVYKGKTAKASEEALRAADVLKIASGYESLESSGMSTADSLDTLLGRRGEYNPDYLRAFVAMKGATGTHRVILELPLRALRPGMMMAEDMRSTKGALLVSRGFQVTVPFLERVRNFGRDFVKEPLRVVVPPQESDDVGPESNS